MDNNELLQKLIGHEELCALRMEAIDQRLEAQDAALAKLERYLVGGFSALGTLIVVTISLIGFIR